MRTLATLLLGVLALGGCDNAGEAFTTPELPVGAIAIGFYLDRDASGGPTTGDTAMAGVRVALFRVDGVDTVKVAVSDADGLAVFDSVPLGRWQVRVDRAALGDSIATVQGDTGTIRLLATRDSAVGGRTVRLAFAEVTPAEARGLPPGRRVVVRGVVGSALQFFADSSTHLTNGTAWLRIVPSRHRPGRNGNNVGDSVSVLGTTGQRNGQPVLLNGLVQTLSERPVPVASPIGVAAVGSASGGLLDAALVSVAPAVIADTVTQGDEFVVRIAEGSDTATVRLDARLQVPKAAFAPGRTLTARGVLVPTGAGGWELKPRPVPGELSVQ